TAPPRREGVVVGGDGLVHRLVRSQVFVFTLQLTIKPARQIAQRLDDDLLGIDGHVLICRTLALDRDRHAVFVIIMPTMAGLGAKLVEIAALDRQQRIGNLMQLYVLRRIGSNLGGGVFPVGVEPLPAGSITLRPEAPKPDARLLPRSAVH